MADAPGKKPTRAAHSAAIDKISLTKVTPELARKHFKSLLLANPNFFGTLKDSPIPPVLKIQGDTTYENIGCVGFNPQVKRLEAVVYIKQQSGYEGGVCSNGSQEFVRFYLSFDGGAHWQDQGLTSFTVYDVPGPKPLEYDATLQIDPPEGFCFFANLPRVRAILSWNTPPPANSPDWPPVWGNVVETNIEVASFKFIPLDHLLAELKVALPTKYQATVDFKQPIKAAPPAALSGADLQALYKDSKVPEHRFLFPELKKAAGAGAVSALKQTAHKPSFAGIPNLNIANIIENLLNTDGDTSFEQLDCVGLNSTRDQLVGVIHVKQSSGYSGGPCTAGSQEYVAFWVDWGSGWTYAGTTSVTVHDFNPLPAGGLHYSVFLPVDLTSHRQPCESGPRTAKVRAVLSWNVPPSNTDPFAPVTWGNSEETLILIAPGPVVPPGMQIPFLSRVGSIDESLIDGNGRITDAYALETGAHFVDAPFGGMVSLAGFISNPLPGMKYRVMKKPHGAPDSAYAPIVNEPGGLTLTIDQFNGVVWTQTQQTFHDLGSGYYPYENYSFAHLVEGNIMQRWYTTAADSGHAFDLRIDLSVDGNPAHDVHSNVVTVLVDNTRPDALLDIDLGAGVECGDFKPGDTFTGHYTASDDNFGGFYFVILPPGPAAGVLPVPPSMVSNHLGGTVADPGVINQVYTLNTTGMAVCGYSLTLVVYDRTNVNSGQTNNSNQASVGFCLRKP